jgi:hypothetical protein
MSLQELNRRAKAAFPGPESAAESAGATEESAQAHQFDL